MSRTHCLVLSVLIALIPALSSAKEPAKARPAPAPAAKKASAPKKPVRAQAEDPNTTTKRVQRMDFDNDIVDVERDTGAGDWVGASRRAKHSQLITVRADFIPEMIKSADDI
jgi:hypothetical protein